MMRIRKSEINIREDLMKEVMTSLPGTTETSVIPIVVSFRRKIL